MSSTSTAMAKAPKTARKKAQPKVAKPAQVAKSAKAEKPGKSEKSGKLDKAAKAVKPAKSQAILPQSPKPGAARRQDAKAPAPKSHVFLIAVKRRREAMRVYAVLAPSEADALDIVRVASDGEAAVEPVGRLSKKLARPLKLRALEPKPI